MDSSTVNQQVIDSINQSQIATMSPQVVLTSGAGKAYQSVSQSAAIAVQDAADALRNISTIATTAAGVAIAQSLANPAEAELYSQVLASTQEMITKATDDFKNIGLAAATILKSFPSG
jgi:hypothetical protein